MSYETGLPRGAQGGGSVTLKEPELLRRIQVRATELGARLFRNASCLAWVGSVVFKPNKVQTLTVYPGDVIIRNATPLKAGLCEGSGDLIGWRSVIITSEMLGKSVAIFSSVEGKTSGTRTTRQQKAWAEAVNAAGGYGVIAHSVDEAMEGLELGGFEF